ncbi:hypothetical protein CSW10_00120 [Mesomycoplasma dispar]|uniref:Uncharacterized protein n=1 Tax=Mesomycoplasma dispar TaxID=86660 RepID=A0ABM6PPX8_9BACT|nr:hypothetical protein CSW10_00120 [Mesomycoplasma dispar]
MIITKRTKVCKIIILEKLKIKKNNDFYSNSNLKNVDFTLNTKTEKNFSKTAKNNFFLENSKNTKIIENSNEK